MCVSLVLSLGTLAHSSSFTGCCQRRAEGGLWRLGAFEQFTSESSQVPQALPASIPSMPHVLALPWLQTPFTALCPTHFPCLELPFPAWSSLSRPFYILEFFRSSNPLMHDTSLNFPDSSNHQQQSLRNTARNQRTCPWPRCRNQYGISKPEENSATEDDLVQMPSLLTPCVSFLQ